MRLPKRYALVNVTDRIEEAIARSRVTDGRCFVSAMHITAGVFRAGVYVNDAESGLFADIAEWIARLAPSCAEFDGLREKRILVKVMGLATD